MHVSLPAFAAGLLAAALPCAALAADMQPGQYKTQVTSDIPGEKAFSSSQ
jgi:hypothetical protein